MTTGKSPKDELPPYLKRGTKAYRSVSLAFLAAGLATFAMLYCVQPIFPVLTTRLHVTPVMASFSLSLTTIFLAVCLPVAAAVSSVIGRKRIMVASLALSSLCCLLSSIAPNFSVFLVLRALQGIVLAGLPASAMAYLGEEIEARGLGFAMGLYVSGTTIGGLLGRMIVSFFSDVTNWRVAIAVIAFISMLMTIFFWRNLPASRHFETEHFSLRGLLKSFHIALQDKGLVCLYLIGGFLMSGFVALYNYTGFRLEGPPYHFSQSLIGLIFVVYLAGTVSSSWMGRLADLFGRRRVMWMNIVIMALGAGITLRHHIVLIIVGTAIFTFGFFGGHSIASSWVGRRAQAAKAQASSLYLLFYYGGSSIGGSAVGVFWVRNGWTGTVAAILVLIACAFLVSLILARIPAKSGAGGAAKP